MLPTNPTGDAMYNRYVPQPDGSYRRNRIPDPTHQSRPRPNPPPQKPHSDPPPIPCDPPKSSPSVQKPRDHSHENGSVTGFLRQLLPKNFDTADLLIVLLLLLMAGNCEEDQNTALLTLALYFFM